MEKTTKKETQKNRNRRHIYIDDALYKKVAKEALEMEVDNGTVIDIALEMYFKNRGV